MSKTVTLSISGRGSDTDAPTIEDFLGQVRDYFEVLSQVEETLAEDGQSAIEWRVTGAAKNSPLSIVAEAFPRQFAVNIDRRTELVIESVSEGFRQLQVKSLRPANFNDKALIAAKSMFERVTNGLELTRLDHGGDRPPIALTTSSARVSAGHVREVLAPKGRPYKELGSVEGHAKRTERDGYGRWLLWIKHRLTGDEIKCFVTGEASRVVGVMEVQDVWKGRRVQVSGTIHYKAAGRISQIDAAQVRFLRDRIELPDIDDIVDLEFTNGMTAEDHLTRVRDGE